MVDYPKVQLVVSASLVVKFRIDRIYIFGDIAILFVGVLSSNSLLTTIFRRGRDRVRAMQLFLQMMPPINSNPGKTALPINSTHRILPEQLLLLLLAHQFQHPHGVVQCSRNLRLPSCPSVYEHTDDSFVFLFLSCLFTPIFPVMLPINSTQKTRCALTSRAASINYPTENLSLIHI